MTALSREIRATFLISAAVAVVLMLPTLLQQPSFQGQLFGGSESVAPPSGVIESLEGGVFVPPGMSPVTPGIIPESFGSPGVVTTPGLGTTGGPTVTTTPSTTPGVIYFSTPSAQQPQQVTQQGGSRRQTVEALRQMYAKIEARSRVAGIAETRRKASLKKSADEVSPDAKLNGMLDSVTVITLPRGGHVTIPVLSRLVGTHSLSVEGLPPFTSVTAISDSSITIAASPRATEGPTVARIVGTPISGGRPVSVPVFLRIERTPLRATSAGFEISLPSKVSLKQGEAGAVRAVAEGAKKMITWSLKDAPKGMTIAPKECIANCDVLVLADSTLSEGEHDIRVSGKSEDGETRSATIVVTVRSRSSAR